MEYRLVAIWDRGGYISTLMVDEFTKEFSDMVNTYGPPDLISCRGERLGRVASRANYFQEKK
jgi:hypothetical protein